MGNEGGWGLRVGGDLGWVRIESGWGMRVGIEGGWRLRVDGDGSGWKLRVGGN